MDRYVGFCEAVEENAIKLEDYFFVRLTPKELKEIAQKQQEAEAKTFIANWEDYVGEVVYLYDRIKDSYYSMDYRIADKDSLTRFAARTLVQYIHDGNGKINDVCLECSIALMLFLRNGFKKRDFARAFQKELIDALKKVMKSKKALEIEKVLLKKPDRNLGKVTKSWEIFEKVYDNIDYYDDIFVFVDSEIEKILWEVNKTRYRKEEIEKAIGHYVLFDHALGIPDMTREMVLENEDRNLCFTSVGNCTYYAASMLEELFFYDDCMLDKVLQYISKGIAIYRKNGLSDADFWKNVCKDFLEILTSDLFFLNWKE